MKINNFTVSLGLSILFALINPALAKACSSFNLDKYTHTKNLKPNYKKITENKTFKSEITSSDGEYIENITILSTPYSIENRFNKDGKLYYSTKYMKGMFIGLSKKYNPDGSIQVFDHQKDLKIKVPDVVCLMKSKYGINIESKKLYHIEITENEEKPIYNVVVYEVDHALKNFKIDASTGEIININNYVENEYPYWKYGK